MSDIHPAGDFDDGGGAEVRRRLRALRVDTPEGAFTAALHRRLTAAAAHDRTAGLGARIARWLRGRPWFAWPALGASCGVAAAVVILAAHGRFRPAEPGPGAAAADGARAQPAAPVRVPADKVAVIHLTFTAEVLLNDVDFSVTLPDGLSFWSEGVRLAERSFSWRGRLAAGENALPIAVRGDRPGRYCVKAVARASGHEVEHEVFLEVVEGA
jgi:hypothetical protein